MMTHTTPHPVSRSRRSPDWRALVELATVVSVIAVAAAIALHLAGVSTAVIVLGTFLAGLVVGFGQPVARPALHRVTVVRKR